MLFRICNFVIAIISGSHRVHLAGPQQPLLPEAAARDQGTLLSFPHTDDTHSSQVPIFTDDFASTFTLTPPIPSPPRNQCIFLCGFKVCDRSSLKKRLRRLGRNKSSADDGFTRLPVVRSQRDDKDDRGRAYSSSGRASSGSPGVRES
ncbi:hypothetical protein JB92DRAFT_410557 [Gautieria morchelliformis]|nr:hypothetical protein JB92DRAFT_410557 [Gautieria morchelliformis]